MEGEGEREREKERKKERKSTEGSGKVGHPARRRGLGNQSAWTRSGWSWSNCFMGKD